MRCLTATLGVGLLASIGAPVYAHWKPQYAGSPYASWFAQQRNANGTSCCDQADGHFYDGAYTLNRDGSVTVGKEVIPKSKVLTGANPTGRPIWWYYAFSDGTKSTICFIPGTLT